MTDSLFKINVLVVLLLLFSNVSANNNTKQEAIISGIPWYDQHGKQVSAHGACVVKEGRKYYLFGEYKNDSTNAFTGFSCYSSSDLYNWKLERMVLPVQNSGKLGPNRVGERVKVMKCPLTGEYVMYMHVDDLNYKDQFVGYATSKKINGVYTFQGALLFNGKPVKKWDMGTFQDTDGKGYVITHSGNLYQLADDYKSITAQIVKDMTRHCEAPVIFKWNGIYYWIGSKLTSWEKNDNYYFTATSLGGPWAECGLIAPEGTLTWNSQSTFVLPIAGSEDTTLMFMGDRWSFPRQHSAATYVWQPLEISQGKLSMPVYFESWKVNLSTGKYQKFNPETMSVFSTNSKQGQWKSENNLLKSNEKDAKLTFKFKGGKVGIKAVSNTISGYAEINIKDHKNKIVLSSIVDFYSKNEYSSQIFLSPGLKLGEYTLTIQVLGDHPSWTDKSKTIYGSTDNFVTIEDVYVL